MALFSACGREDEPPTLPGNEPPPCTLAPARTFLVDGIDLGGNGRDPEYDLSEPPDGTFDNAVGRFYWAYPNVQPFWDPGLTAALETDQVSWLISVETCSDESPNYARFTVVHAAAIDRATTPPTAEVIDDGAVPAVGRLVDQRYEAHLGTGSAPVSAFVDSEADKHPADWLPAVLIAFYDVALDGDELTGALSFATQEGATLSSMARGIASTMTEAQAADPGCPDSCTDESLGSMMMNYDTNGDGSYSMEEVAASTYFQSTAGRATLDLFASVDGAEVFWPGRDDAVDSMGTRLQFVAHTVSIGTP